MVHWVWRQFPVAGPSIVYMGVRGRLVVNGILVLFMSSTASWMFWCGCLFWFIAGSTSETLFESVVSCMSTDNSDCVSTRSSVEWPKMI